MLLEVEKSLKSDREINKPEAIAAVHLAGLALRWKIMRDLSGSAARRLERVLAGVHEPILQSKFHLVLWTLRKLPYVRTSLVVRALEELEMISEYLGGL